MFLAVDIEGHGEGELLRFIRIMQRQAGNRYRDVLCPKTLGLLHRSCYNP